MWKVTFTQECQKKFEADFKEGKFNSGDGDAIKIWFKEMKRFGPDYIERNKKWDDHPLQDEWTGHRSSCFSRSGRIIYKVVGNTININVVRVTPDHNYKK
ncbi:MAG: hypothetical protein ISR65_18935 [Bacteriovoracaceae bacterium]|nr:hypothetical protein [Bacteriovoracaceae bacterium]